MTLSRVSNFVALFAGDPLTYQLHNALFGARQASDRAVFFKESNGELQGARVVDFYRDTCELFEVQVKTDARRRGIATSLLHEALKEAETRGCTRVFAPMATQTPARLALFAKYQRIIKTTFPSLRFEAAAYLGAAQDPLMETMFKPVSPEEHKQFAKLKPWERR